MTGSPLGRPSGTMRWGSISSPLVRLFICVLAVVGVFSVMQVSNRPLSAELDLFLIVVLLASIGWGARYAVFLSCAAALGFAWSLPPAGHFHFSDLSSRRDGNSQLLISVSDTGAGLPPDADKIFNAFFTTKPQGTGMGLAISRSIIESHGGQLWAGQNSARATILQFTLPAAGEAWK